MSSAALTVLIVDDEIQMRRLLRTTLPPQGYITVEAASGREALAISSAQSPDLILLDLGLPDCDGLDMTAQLRKITKAPIIVLSGREHEPDKVAALDAGADDYVTKPFSMKELLARMRVASRRTSARHTVNEPDRVIVVDQLRVDIDRRQVFANGREVHLTPLEWRLLTTLALNAGRVMTHPQILKEVWGARYKAHTQYLHVYMGQLRNKLEVEPTRPRLLITEPGVGYRLRSE